MSPITHDTALIPNSNRSTPRQGKDGQKGDLITSVWSTSDSVLTMAWLRGTTSTTARNSTRPRADCPRNGSERLPPAFRRDYEAPIGHWSAVGASSYDAAVTSPNGGVWHGLYGCLRGFRIQALKWSATITETTAFVARAYASSRKDVATVARHLRRANDL